MIPNDRPRYNIYVDGKFEFSFFQQPQLLSKDQVKEYVFAEKDWKWFCDFFKVKPSRVDISDDFSTIKVTTKSA